MYVSELVIENFRCFGGGDEKFTLPLRPGLTVLVGENSVGKSTVIDALRLVLGTRDRQSMTLQASDFHLARTLGDPITGRSTGSEFVSQGDDGKSNPTHLRSATLNIRCRIEMNNEEASDFVGYALQFDPLTGDMSANPLYLHLAARTRASTRDGHTYVDRQLRAGLEGDGERPTEELLDLLRTVYLQPLRDAEKELSARQSSRLSQILICLHEILKEEDLSPSDITELRDISRLSVLGTGDFGDQIVTQHKNIKTIGERLSKRYLSPMSFSGDSLAGLVAVEHPDHNLTRLRQLLERMELRLLSETDPDGLMSMGLGMNNLLYMATELLLLDCELRGLRLLLIEEPEAHLHPQRQLRLMNFLDELVQTNIQSDNPIQVIMTTHSPNLASSIKLDNLVMISGNRAYSLREGQTKLDVGDYKFLERFLDVTKANMFFARGLIIVEGHTENILLPTLARLMGRELSRYGVSIVNVGGVGLGRYARIYQRSDEEDTWINVKVACIADRDRRGLQSVNEIDEARERVRARTAGQNVATFVTESRTLETEFIEGSLAKEWWIAAYMAKHESTLLSGDEKWENIVQEATSEYVSNTEGKSAEDRAQAIEQITLKEWDISKPTAALYLCQVLENKVQKENISEGDIRDLLPEYLVQAIEHVTEVPNPAEC